MKLKIKMIAGFLEKHGPSILTGIAVIGVVITGYLTNRATQKVTMEVAAEAERPENSEIPIKEIKKRVTKENWKAYIPSMIAGVGTIACVVGANYWHISRESAMAAAVAFYKASESELKNAIKEKYGEDSLEELKKDIAKKRMEDDRPPWEPKDSTKMTIFEPYTKQWFRASQQEILWAELTANKMLQQTYKVKLNDILAMYDGCKKTKLGEIIGWSMEDEMFLEAIDYSPSRAAWITFTPISVERPDGSIYFEMDYEIHPNEFPEDELPFVRH